MKNLFLLMLVVISNIQVLGQDVTKAKEYFDAGKFDSAAMEYEAALPLLEKKLGASDSSFYFTQVNLTAQAFEAERNTEKALQYYHRAKEILETHNDTVSRKYIRALYNLASNYSNVSNFKAALPLYEQAVRINKMIFGTKHLEYANSLYYLSTTYRDMGNSKASLSILTEVKNIKLELLGPKDTLYAESLANLAVVYSDLEKYAEALPLAKEAVLINKEILGPRHTNYAHSMNILSLIYTKMENYQAALPIQIEATAIMKENMGGRSFDYARSINNLGMLYDRIGNFAAAIPLLKESVKITKEAIGERNPSYVSYLNNLSGIYRMVGNYDAALQYCKESVYIVRELLGPKHHLYATILDNLAGIYGMQKNYKAALPLFEESIAVFKEIYGVKNNNYAKSLGNIAACYSRMGKYDKALILRKEAAEIYKEVLGDKSASYGFSLSYIGSIYYFMDSIHLAVELSRKACEIQREALGNKHTDYIRTLGLLALLNVELGNYDTALVLYREANAITSQNIKENFSILSLNQKEEYLKMVGNDHELFLSSLLIANQNQPEFSRLGFDNEILYKGLILNSVVSMQEAIWNSRDTSLNRRFEQLQQLKRQIAAMLQKPVAKRSQELPLYEKQANELEGDLAARSQIFNEVQASFSIKTEDIQKKLNENEVAIEFVNIQFNNGKRYTDTVFYCALIIKKQDRLQKTVVIGEESQLKNIIPGIRLDPKNINTVYNNQSLYNLIWKPLEPYLEGINTIYYAPSGLLNNISMAAINCQDNQKLVNKYNLVQLSSTRTIALPDNQKVITSAAVFGGIRYEADTVSLQKQASKYRKGDKEILVYSRSGSTETRKGFNYLPGTRKEAELITQQLQKKNIPTSIYTELLAPEESFSALSGKDSPGLIHVSTHGFYYPDTLSEKQRREMDLFESAEQRSRFSDDPLLRSGLLMAGANLAWKGGKVPEGLEDGILTAKEVSNLDLRNTQLVVLSACQTGLGDVKGSEGVEGLQRGFKMAGVRYLIMSLWEVPDKETQEFMVAFYDYWLGGKPIREAFRATQLKMKNKYPRDPYKWAGFVLTE